MAKAFGAEVTGVCSTAKVDLVRSLGADHVIDYTREDFADGRQRYDLILDIGGNIPLSRLRRALTASGTLVIVGGETAAATAVGPAVPRAGALRRWSRQQLTIFIYRDGRRPRHAAPSSRPARSPRSSTGPTRSTRPRCHAPSAPGSREVAITSELRRCKGAYGTITSGDRGMAGQADGGRPDHAVRDVGRAPDHDHHDLAGAGIANAGGHGDQLVRDEPLAPLESPGRARGRPAGRPPGRGVPARARRSLASISAMAPGDIMTVVDQVSHPHDVDAAGPALEQV